MTPSINGFYAAYLTGAQGQGFLLFILRNGIVVGVDVGDAKYDGTYTPVDGGFDVNLKVEFPPNSDLVQGVRTGPETVVSELHFTLPADFLSRPFLRIEAQHGPLNAKITKMRDLND